MLLRNLFEAANNEVAIIFGRFNPPHKGHRAAWEMASQSPVWYVGTNESTVGPKDPLPFDVKVEAMKTVWPEVAGHIMPETSWLTMASEIYKKYPKATLLCLTDEDWVTKTIVQYNGKEGAHGFYNFKNITQKPTPRLSSATALRDAVSKGDREAFSQAAGVSADTKMAGKPFFDLVAEYLLPYANTPKKVVKKKKEPVAAEGKKPQHNLGVGWMLDKDKALGQKVAQSKAKSRQEKDTMQKYAGKKVAEGAPIVVALPPIDVRNPKKAPQPFRNQGDIVPPTKPPSTKKRGVKGRAGQRPMPKYDESAAMAQTAKRLTDPKDGATAKLRAAGDKRREDQLKSRNIAKKNEAVDLKTSLQELSNDMLGTYKKAAGADAKKADASGDFKRGDKRFKGINKATVKQFDNDAKKNK